MKKDIFNYIQKPNEDFYRKDSCIDKIYELEEYSLDSINDYVGPNKTINTKKLLVNNGVINYKNLIAMTKINYMEAMLYKELAQQENDDFDKESYDFLARMLLEDVIIKLFSAYDRTYIILNDLYDFKISVEDDSESFKRFVRERIKEEDRKKFKRINSIFYRLNGSKAKEYRDDITHNRSISLNSITTNYKTQRRNICFKTAMPIDKLEQEIEMVCDLLEEYKNLLNEIIIEKNK